MAFSFSRKSRMAANQNHGVTRTLAVTADRYGLHQGTKDDNRWYRTMYQRLFNCVPYIVEGVDTNLWPQITASMDEIYGKALAKNAARQEFPLAIHCAWGAAVTLSETFVNDITDTLGIETYVASATIFFDQYPGIKKLNPAPDVLARGGNGLSVPRQAGAVAPTLLGLYALEEGLL